MSRSLILGTRVTPKERDLADEKAKQEGFVRADGTPNVSAWVRHRLGLETELEEQLLKLRERSS